MNDPVSAGDGNVYERYAITDWWTNSDVSPLDNVTKISLAGLTSIRLLKNQIEDYFTSDDCSAERKEEFLEAKNKPKKLYDEGKVLEAANIGYKIAMVEMAGNFKEGINGYAKNKLKAFKWATKAAYVNDKKGQFRLGYCYRHGIGVARDHVAAWKWYELAGDAESFNSMGLIYYHGKYGVDKDFTKAAECCRKAADLGDKVAQWNLAEMYYDGEGVEKSFAEARRFLKLSADQDDVDAQYELGLMMMKGEGGEKNIPEGIALIQQSAGKDNEDAKKCLAIIEGAINGMV